MSPIIAKRPLEGTEEIHHTGRKSGHVRTQVQSLLEEGSMVHLAWPITVHTRGSPGCLGASRSSGGKIRTQNGIDSGSNRISDSSNCQPWRRGGSPVGKNLQWESSWPDHSWSSSPQHLHSY
ncbi:hypothetical protein Cadr_000001032 [Camelus dromedarius]|uniref:Uncharacterized protein n=1 Tax=Camelus dromedarius TaxID=9838 RepID=A0A5N4EJT1_CAMDR|nr:hypothetical protein Cadr_000001032 [Camelus dromedarius]